MIVSTKGRYALRVMVELAAAPQGEYQPLARISEGQGISLDGYNDGGSGTEDVSGSESEDYEDYYFN